MYRLFLHFAFEGQNTEWKPDASSFYFIKPLGNTIIFSFC